MSDHNSSPKQFESRSLPDMREAAFDRIEADSERYASQPHAIAVYVQEALFALSTIQKRHEEALRERDALMEASEGDIILLRDELAELRLRAAYHGAGLAAEPPQNIPRPVSNRLWDNLENYPPTMDYKQEYFPWSYRFTPDALRHVLAHDFRIAAVDSADGDLHRLCSESEEGEYNRDMERNDFTPETTTEEDPWDKQARLTAELRALEASKASAEEIDAKIIEINDHVVYLVELGLIDDEEAWAHSVGFNAGLDDPDQHGDF